MKNRAKLLCLKFKIETPNDYALKIGISEDLAKQIWDETIEIPNEVIVKSCELFDCCDAYFLCQCERVK